MRAATPHARSTTVSVLNGNGQAGSASNASYLLGQRGYRMIVPAERNTSPDHFRTKVYYDSRKRGARAAATKIANLFGSADVSRVPATIRRLGGGAMIVVIVGQTFHGNLATSPVDRTPKREPAAVVPNADLTRPLLRHARGQLPFRLQVPTVIERSSVLDSDQPLRVYDLNRDHKAVRLTFRSGAAEYWGIQMTDWADAPALSERNFGRVFKGRRYDLYYNGSKLHMVVLRHGGATYWVVNTLLDSLSNETMLAIAKGLRPL